MTWVDASNIYTYLGLYKKDYDSVPFWQLPPNEVNYYKWLFKKPEFAEARKACGVNDET